MNLKSFERRAKDLSQPEMDPDFLQTLCIERVLDSATAKEAARFEDAITEQLALADAGFTEAEIEGMLRPETFEVLEDLLKRAEALLPEIKRQQAALYRRRYAPMAEARDD